MILYLHTKELHMDKIQIELKKQPQKYLLKVDTLTYKKLRKALDKLAFWEGDIKALKGTHYYRLKITGYRFIFEYDDGINLIAIEEINTRTNIKYRRYQK